MASRNISQTSFTERNQICYALTSNKSFGRRIGEAQPDEPSLYEKHDYLLQPSSIMTVINRNHLQTTVQLDDGNQIVFALTEIHQQRPEHLTVGVIQNEAATRFPTKNIDTCRYRKHQYK